MAVVFVIMICLAVAGPFVAFAWAMKPRQCPNCGAAVSADPQLVRTFVGE